MENHLNYNILHHKLSIKNLIYDVIYNSKKIAQFK